VNLFNEIFMSRNWGVTHGNGSRRGMHWLSWERLTTLKGFGGMGFKSLKAFNMAMLGKQAWKLITNPDSLITRLLKARYFPTSDFFASQVGHNPSYVWRSIWNVKVVIQNGFKWSIGSGTSISVWDPHWIRSGYTITPLAMINPAMANLCVADLLVPNLKIWHMENISILFDNVSAYHISRTPLLASVQNDRAVWKFEKNGVYSVYSAYRDIMERDLNTHQNRIVGD